MVHTEQMSTARPIFCVLVLALTSIQANAQEVLRSYAQVNDDASLVIKGQVIELAGLYIPKTRDSCITRPAEDCRTRASAALEFRIRGFIECRIVAAGSSRQRLAGFCHADKSTFDQGTDLGAYLIERGWAMADPDAPFEYQALEKLARERDRGFWGNGRVWTPGGFR